MLLLWAAGTMAQGSQPSGPAGKYVRSILCYDGKVYAATGGGVYASDSHGSGFTLMNSGLTSLDTKCLARMGDTLFVATDENVFWQVAGQSDWHPCGTRLQGYYCKHILAHDGVLYAGTYLEGVWRSRDRGTTWENISPQMPVDYVYYLEAADGNLYLGTYLMGCLVSDDQGDHWTDLSMGLGDETVIAMHAFGGKIFASTMSGGVYKMGLDGWHWSAVPASLPGIKGFCHYNDTLYAASFGNGLYCSTDTGATWVHTSSGYEEAWCVAADERMVYMGLTDGSVFRTSHTGVPSTQGGMPGFNATIGGLAFAEDRMLASSHGSGLHYSDNGGSSWTETSGIGTVEVRCLLAACGVVLAGTDMLGLYRSIDNGAHFSTANTGLQSYWIQCLAADSSTFYAGSGNAGVFASADGGQTWASLGLNTARINALAPAAGDLWAATDEGLCVRSAGIAGWQHVGVDVLGTDVTAVAVCGGRVWVGTRSRGLFWCPAEGGEWSRYAAADSSIRCLSVSGQGCLLVGLEAGRWMQISPDDIRLRASDTFDIGSLPILAIAENADGTFFFGTPMGICQSAPLPMAGLASADTPRPLLVYPNPASGSCTLDLGEGEHRVTVTDLLGRPLLSITTTQPYYRLQGFPAGQYFVRTDGRTARLLWQ